MIQVSLPLTNPTGRVRVKTRNKRTDFGIPVATRKTALGKKHYIEWQISYSTTNKDIAKYPNIYYENNLGKQCYAYELSEYIYQCLKEKRISLYAFQKLFSYIAEINDTNTIDQISKITRCEEDIIDLANISLTVIKETHPAFLYIEKSDYSIECIVKHRQRAIGYQVMVFLCLPLSECMEYENIHNRPATQKEMVTYNLSQDLLFDCCKLFALSSSTHYKDIYALSTCIAQELKLDSS